MFVTQHVIDSSATSLLHSFLVGMALKNILKYDLGDVTVDCFR